MVTKICGVNPRKVSGAVMAEQLARLGLTSTGAIPVKIQRLMDYMRERICGCPSQTAFDEWVERNPTNQNVVVCDPGCGGISTLDKFEICPFCGDGAMNIESASKQCKKIKKY